jgi:hypothetical protein
MYACMVQISPKFKIPGILFHQPRKSCARVARTSRMGKIKGEWETGDGEWELKAQEDKESNDGVRSQASS